MVNIFTSQPDLISHATVVTGVRETSEGRLAVTVSENILRPAGGGQPQDYGMLETAGGAVPVGRVFKADGETWLELDGVLASRLAPSQEVVLRLDAQRRSNLSRCHSLTHLGMAAVRGQVAGYESKGADIADNARDLTLYFRSERPLTSSDLYRIDVRLRSLVHQAIPIRVERARSMDEAARAYSTWRADPDNPLSGRLRIIHIEGVDANPCSGSHVADTAKIGPFEVRGRRVDGRGVTALSLRRLETWMSW